MAAEDKIEEAIQNRELAKARVLIARFLKSGRQSDNSRLYAAIYYRWIGEFGRALKIVGKDLKGKTRYSSTGAKIKLQMEAVRLINYQGGEGFALNFISHASKEYFGEQMAFVYLWNGKYREALAYFQRVITLPDSELNDDNRVLLGYAALCQFELDQCERARKNLDRLFKLQNTPLMVATLKIISARGFRVEKNFSSAVSECEDALKILDDSEEASPQRIEALTCLASCFAELKRYTESEKIFKYVLELAFRPGTTSYEWLEIYFWKGLLTFRRDQVFPDEWKQLLVYPNAQPAEYSQKIKKYTNIPDEILWPLKKKDQIEIQYDLSDETISFPGNPGKKRIGLKLLDRGLCALVQAGELGISQYRLFDVLWPNDSAIVQAQVRITQLIARLRAQGYKISWKKGHLNLSNAEALSVTWRAEAKPFGWGFLSSRTNFTREEVQATFDLSKSSATNLCLKWSQESLIESVGNGRTRSYLVCR